jgi:hypothetical protein
MLGSMAAMTGSEDAAPLNLHLLAGGVTLAAYTAGDFLL